MTVGTIAFDGDYVLLMDQQRNSPAGQKKFERQLELLQPRPGDRVLDLGCGSGAHARLLASRVGPSGEVVGVDVEPEAIEVAIRLTEADPSLGLSFQVADAHHLPFDDAAFDAAICVSVLAFCEDPLQVLREVGRVLRPGGRILLVNSDEDTRIYNSNDRELGRKVLRAIADRARDPWIGRRLAGLLTAAGFIIAAEDVRASAERDYGPEHSGYLHARSMRAHVLEAGSITDDEYERWLADLAQCARDGSYLYSVTTFSYVGEK